LSAACARRLRDGKGRARSFSFADFNQETLELVASCSDTGHRGRADNRTRRVSMGFG
jgi:hypothetical protein